MKPPREFIDVNRAFSREADRSKTCVQDRVRTRRREVAPLLQNADCFIYLCGL